MVPSGSFRPRSPRDRVAHSSPDPPSPLDSGYGSASPGQLATKQDDKENELPLTDFQTHYDGNQSDSDDTYFNSDQENILTDVESTFADSISGFRTARSFHKRPATLAQRTPRSLPALPASYYSPNATARQRGFKTASLRHLDRYIPARQPGRDAVESFRTSKPAYEMTANERFVRHSGATEDPFVYRRRILTPVGAETRSRSRVGAAAASRNEVGNVLGPLDQNSIGGNDARVGSGNVWTIGPGGTAVNNGRGQLVRSGTNARLFRATFPTEKQRSEEETEKYKGRIAAALGLDRMQRVLEVSLKTYYPRTSNKPGFAATEWSGTEWVNGGPIPKPQKPLGNRTLPTAPFKVLDAPNLRDDFYCSILAYSPTCKTLAVGLGNLLYGWSETRGVRLLNPGTGSDSYLTSLSFSSVEGCKAILAFGRSDKTLGLLSLFDDQDPTASRSAPRPRFEVVQPSAVACLSWKPVCTVRPSRNHASPGISVKNEDLLVGDEIGMIYYYAVEWPERWEVERNNWPGDMTLLARIAAHTQQICGLAWSKNGNVFGTGGNDNICYLFDALRVLENYPANRDHSKENQGGHSTGLHVHTLSETSEAETEIQMLRTAPYHPVIHLGPSDARHRWVHGAAVKAIAFCPWQDSLVATGGGSNDKCIHFFHIGSGAALSSISVSAQVTSLIWSTTRREIAATFGYAHPDHPVRIAVFSWPECRLVAAIPWAGEHRALYAIPYPRGPDDMAPARLGVARSWRTAGQRYSSNRTAKEGCIIVASSDKSVKFYEVWMAEKKGTANVAGVLGESPILEYLEGIDREEMVIR